MTVRVPPFFERLPLRTQILLGTTGCMAVVVLLCATIGGIFSFQYAAGARMSYLSNVALTGSASLNQQLLVVAQVADEVATTVAAGAMSNRSRAQTAERLRLTLVREPNLFGVWFVSEANAYDGRDSRFRGIAPSDANGVFVPYWVRDGSGSIVQDTTGLAATSAEDWAEPYYRIPATTRKATLLEPYLDVLEGQGDRAVLMTTLAEPVEVDGRLIGVAGVDLALQAFQAVIAQLGRETQTDLLVVSANGTVIGGTLAAAAPGSRVTLGPADGSFSDLFGYEALSTTVALNGPAGSPAWSLVVAEPKTRSAQLGWTIAGTIALGGLFVILLAALLVFRTTPLITRRFEALADRLNRLSKGELDTRFEEGTPPFLEGQQIAEAAAAVRVALSERIALAALLEGQRADLESRVAERTGELQAALAVAQSSEAAKTAFLANMSHEIRTPLNGVIGVAETLRRSPLAPDQAAMVELIVSSGAALQRLLGDVLDLSRVESGEITLAYSTFDLRKTVESAAGLFRISAENKGLEFTINYRPGAAGFIETDEARLRQILVNLTANAVKFTERGSVTIEVDVQGDGDQAQLVFRVTDTGIGFDQSRTDALFSRFVQADVSITRKYGGTGLGLALSKAIADRLGGDIQAQSRLGQGSTFILTIPCLKKPTPPALPAPEVATGAPFLDADAAHLRVLVAEDNLANQRVIKLLLDPLGVDVTITNNGQEALEAFTAQDFDIVLMDMQMPVMDGLTASRAVRALEVQRGSVPTPILMLTANGTPEHIAEARAAGCDDYLIKPITPKLLAEAITRALCP